MNNHPSKAEIIACITIHNIDRLAIGVDYDRDGSYCWACTDCEHTFLDVDLPFWHKYSAIWHKRGK